MVPKHEFFVIFGYITAFLLFSLVLSDPHGGPFISFKELFLVSNSWGVVFLFSVIPNKWGPLFFFEGGIVLGSQWLGLLLFSFLFCDSQEL